MTTTAKISALTILFGDANPHMNATQVGDMVFLALYGEYHGTEAHKRAMYLCQAIPQSK